ncbi:hypothetical protein ABIA30_004277 [Mycobacterium sp. MAA66]|uniref:hypothetical protein n=1 Tax=Mycobacterium sp. MAA66 TaxID=3156297 RepID=UPI0035178FC7
MIGHKQPQPPRRAVSLDEQRDRRRKVLPIVYGGTFDLTREVTAICGPLAYSVSTLVRPVSARREVDQLADAVAEVVHAAAGLVGESRAADGQTRRLAVDLAVRPRQPVITDDMLTSGTWSAVLADYAAEVTADLRKLLGRALPPGANELRGKPSASERIERALREVDTAALALERRIPKLRERQALPTLTEFNAEQAGRRDAERAARRLAQIGR